MKSDFVVEWELDDSEYERIYKHSTEFEHLHEVLDFVSMQVCRGHAVTVTPYWRREA